MGITHPEQQSRKSKGKTFWKAIGICSLFLAVYLYGQRGRPERLIPWANEDFVISEGCLYWSPDRESFSTEQVGGKQQRELIQNYLYFCLLEKHRSWWDTLTNDNTHAEAVNALYRLRLPGS